MATLAGLTASCGGVDTGDESTVLVLAAASLTTAFTDIEAAFEAAHDGIDIDLSFSGSSAIRLQVEEGAPADVVALAHEALIDDLLAASFIDDASVFATNELTIAVPADNPAGISSIDDFADDSLLLGACAAQVPCGIYAAEVLERADIMPALDTEEPNVATLASKVADGELDAALVYTTDVLARPTELRSVALPSSDDLSIRYPIAVVDQTPDSQRFVDFVLSEEGREILAEAGFGLP